MSEHIITNAQAAIDYLFSGNATATLVSKESGKRYTYKISAPYANGKRRYDEPVRFAKLRVPEEQGTWQYLGVVRGGLLHAGVKGNGTHPAFRALDWALRSTYRRADDDTEVNPSLEIWHSGTCGRCGRELTDPASIARGLGPECATKV